jgi:hypothetical protein
MFSFARNAGKFLISSIAFKSNFHTSNLLKMPTAVVVLPPGAEEMEFVGSVDILRRGGVRKIYFFYF